MGTQTVIGAVVAGFKAKLFAPRLKHLGNCCIQKVDLLFHGFSVVVEIGDEGETGVGILEDGFDHFYEFAVGCAVGFVTREDKFRTS